MNDDEIQKKAENNVSLLKHSAKWMSILGALVLGFLYIYWLGWSLQYDQIMITTFHNHMRAIVGVPGAIITAFVIVTVLEQFSGPIEFEVLGFKLKGAAGPGVLWIATFLTIVLGIKVLW
jgi:hypothetical protein